MRTRWSGLRACEASLTVAVLAAADLEPGARTPKTVVAELFCNTSDMTGFLSNVVGSNDGI